MTARPAFVTWIALVLVLGTTARAQPSLDARPADVRSPGSELDYLVRAAHDAANAGNCDNVKMLGDRVRTLDTAYYVATFTTDPAIASCTEPGQKSPGVAVMLSISGTLGGIVVGSVIAAKSEVAGEHGDSHLAVLAGYSAAGAAFAFGPSLGRVYVGGAWNGWLGLRLVGVGAFVLGAALDFAGATPRAVDAPPLGLTLGVLGGGVVYTIGMIGENVATPLTAVEHERLARHRDVALVPLRTRDGAGLALVGRF